jgi:thiol-disulfide isomerase/thioredoxin
MPASHLFRALAALATLLSTSLAAASEKLPRYDLPVGRTLSYTNESRSSRTNADGAGGGTSDTSRGTVYAMVVAANPDGSRRVILRTAFSSGTMPEQAVVGAVDVFADGRSKPVGRPNPRVNASAIFPLLPPDEGQADKWVAPVDWTGNVVTFTAVPSQSGAEEFVFSGVQDGWISRIYVTTQNNTYHFDRVKRVIVAMGGESSQAYGVKQTSKGKMKLEKDESIDAGRAAALGTAYAALFDAEARYLDVVTRINEEPENATKLADQAKAVLTDAMNGVGEAEVVKEFQRQIKQHDEYAKYYGEEARRLAGILNKPAAQWSAKDLDGRQQSQADLKGKVVVMDFWYRGCGWCMYAMPQVKQIAADYKDKGVVVLGMNTDTVEDDARLVIKEFGLSYPQVKAEGLPAKFGVQGFPSIVIIDQAGVVRGFHSGYSPDLREKVGKRIDELLAKKPA